jgi:four helix bundle protein
METGLKTPKNFEDLEVWQKAIDLAVEIYSITKTYPKEELYALSNQMRRAASSISANIAEGYGRYNIKEKTQFYKITNGSLLEVKSFCYLSQKLGYITVEELDTILLGIVPLQKQLNALIRAVGAKNE